MNRVTGKHAEKGLLGKWRHANLQNLECTGECTGLEFSGNWHTIALGHIEDKANQILSSPYSTTPTATTHTEETDERRLSKHRPYNRDNAEYHRNPPRTAGYTRTILLLRRVVHFPSQTPPLP